MAIQGVDLKCYILALFIRDDGERFLLGSGRYEFKDKQRHFAANTMQNDVVEVQGNDGFLLAGQVKRPGSQSFDGYIGDGTTSKQEVEEYRRDFFSFFRKNFFYQVIYIFPDGTAIQRKRGFLVDAPVVQELYQIYPEYHVALNFEDVNYYSYSENSSGEEEFAKSATISLSAGGSSGGLVWDELGAVAEGFQWGEVVTATGTEITVQNDSEGALPITDAKIYGDTFQQTYSGKNLLNVSSVTQQGVTGTVNADGTYTISGTATATDGAKVFRLIGTLPAGTYTFSISKALPSVINFSLASGVAFRIPAGQTSATLTTTQEYTTGDVFYGVTNGVTYNETFEMQLVAGSTADYDFEPYVGGTASPNPDYPQEVQTVTGRQLVTVTNGSTSEEYEINLGKNLFDASKAPSILNAVDNVSYNSQTFTLSIPSNASTAQGNRYAGFYLTGLTSGTYNISYSEYSGSVASTSRRIMVRSYNGTSATELGIMTSAKSMSFTVPANSQRVEVFFYTTQGTTSTFKEVQLELGSTATSYAPYFEPIELCKIGNAQDYIYRSSGEWYLRKRCSKVILDGSESWTDSSTQGTTFVRGLLGGFAALNSRCYCDQFTYRTGSHGNYEYIWIQDTTGNLYLQISDNRLSAHSLAAFKDWLAANKPAVYSILATPTDTLITNQALIEDLNGLVGAEFSAGESQLVVSASGNLVGELEVSYYGSVDFEGGGFVWEEGGPSGPTTVEVDSIENVYPIWEVKGPATNPQLSVLTTNTTLRYNGTVAAGQTLAIDMMSKTAKLNGTSVIGNVSGEWVNFVPGNNRVVYTTNNANAESSTIYWQEVVG